MITYRLEGWARVDFSMKVEVDEDGPYDAVMNEAVRIAKLRLGDGVTAVEFEAQEIPSDDCPHRDIEFVERKKLRWDGVDRR